ncbi:MAG: hypothetical protein K6G84_12930 [Lachnospiraceae bacterium]|nr:hypothetical protein [Lachnospiraceae bacterium]
MIKEKQWFNIFIIIGIMFLVFFGKNEVVYADSISTKVEVSCSSYEMPEKNPYKYDDLDITDKMSFGLKSLGKLYVCGKDISQKSFNDIDAYGISGNASLVYSFDQSIVNASDDKWHLVKDKTKKVNGKKLDSNILGGVMLIEKSYSGDNYVNVGSPICDYFNTNKASTQVYRVI